MPETDELIGKRLSNNSGKEFDVIETVVEEGKKKRYKVKFLDTDYESIAYKANIMKGAVADKSNDGHLRRKYNIGDIIENNKGERASILYFERSGKKHRKAKMKFLESGYTTYCTVDNFKRGKIRDFLALTVHGVGRLGYVSHIKNFSSTSEYMVWESVVARCYSELYKDNIAYKEAYMTERWLRFDYFLEDISKIEGYNTWKKYKEDNPSTKNIYEFDKDTKVIGNKLYSLETCRFIHKKYNAGFTSWAHEEARNRILEGIKGENIA